MFMFLKMYLNEAKNEQKKMFSTILSENNIFLKQKFFYT